MKNVEEDSLRDLDIVVQQLHPLDIISKLIS